MFSHFDSSYEDLLTKVNMPTLQLDGTIILAREVFKILNGLSPSYIQDLVALKRTNYSFRYQNQLEQPRVNTDRYGKKNIFALRLPTSGTAFQMTWGQLRTSKRLDGWSGPGEAVHVNVPCASFIYLSSLILIAYTVDSRYLDLAYLK